jgi:hypothetical protein
MAQFSISEKGFNHIHSYSLNLLSQHQEEVEMLLILMDFSNALVKVERTTVLAQLENY